MTLYPFVAHYRFIERLHLSSAESCPKIFSNASSICMRRKKNLFCRLPESMLGVSDVVRQQEILIVQTKPHRKNALRFFKFSFLGGSALATGFAVGLSETAYAACSTAGSGTTTTVVCSGADTSLTFDQNTLLPATTDLQVRLGTGVTRSNVTGDVRVDLNTGGDLTFEQLGIDSSVSGNVQLLRAGNGDLLASFEGTVGGIYAGDVNGGTIVLNALGIIASTEAYGVEVNNSGPGDTRISSGRINVTTDAPVTSRAGIRNVLDSSSGNVTITANGPILVENASTTNEFGIVSLARNGSNGDQRIVTRSGATIDVESGIGISAFSNGSGDISIDVGADINAGLQGVEIGATGSSLGDVFLNSASGTLIQSSQATGISLVMGTIGGPTPASEVNMTLGGDVNGTDGLFFSAITTGQKLLDIQGLVQGTTGDGVRVVSSGPFSATNNGTIQGQETGLSLNASFNGSVNISGAGDFIGTTGSGIKLFGSAASPMTLNLSGDVIGGTTGIDFQVASNPFRLTSSGLIRGGSHALVGNLFGNSAFIDNSGIIDGLIDVGGDLTDVVALTNSGQWFHGQGQSNFGGDVDNSGLISMESGEIVVLNLTNSGNINTQNGIAGDALVTVNNNYVGGGGVLRFDATLGGSGSVADKMVVRGNTSGLTNIAVRDTNISLGAFNPDGIALVDVDGTTAASHFALAGGPISKGIFTYDLELDTVTNTHELVSKANPLADAPTAVVSGLQNVWNTTSDTWVTRQNDLRDAMNSGPVITAVADPVVQEQLPGTVWMAALGNWTEREASAAKVGFDQDTYGLIAGADFGNRLNDATTLLFGLQGGYVTSDIDVDTGAGSGADVKGATFGASMSLLHRGFFANAMVNADLLKADIAVAGSTADSVSANTLGARADVGYRADFGGAYIEPMVSGLFSHTNLDDFSAAGVAFSTEESDQAWLGAGLRAGMKSNDLSLSLTGRVWNSYASDNAIAATPVGPSFTLTDAGLYDGVFGELDGQMAYAVGTNTALFAEGKLRFDDDTHSLLGKLGVNMTW
jgi:outer membrane autotransporter protein